MYEKGTFSVMVVYKRVRVWTSGRSLPVKNSVEYPPELLNSDYVEVFMVQRHSLDSAVPLFWFTIYLRGVWLIGMKSERPRPQGLSIQEQSQLSLATTSEIRKSVLN